MSAPGNPGNGANSADETGVQPTEARRDPTVRFTPGTLLAGRYRIISPLGKGGMGEVYRADDIRLGQPVALKFLPAALAADAGRLERLVDEVRIGRQISHPNVCRLYDIAEAEGHHFLVMEYVDGEDLASLLRRIGRLPGDKALEIARGVCAGLAAAHDKGVIHRDLKPANVMVDGHGHARIADFGLAALAASGPATGFAGTPGYMAPEQLTGEGASLRSDVFALGLVMHEMLTGRRVFEAKTLEELRALHAEAKPLSLSSSVKDVDPAVERVVLRCLARDPKDRPASAAVVLATLPGGDPLQAALLAGETPSPEMVAAASKVGDLRPAVAWACLLSGLVGLVLVASLTDRVAPYHVTPLVKPPEVLVERAKEVLARLGYREAPADSAHGFDADSALLDHVRRQHLSPDWWQRLRTSRPGPYLFWYRDSPQALFSRSWILTPPWTAPAELGRVTRADPPPNEPGMNEVLLDAQGRLARFVAVPPPFDAASAPEAEPEWAVAVAEAGFDPKALQPTTPRWAAPVDSDRKAAWDGVNPDQPEVPIHVEAASYHGRPVYFEVRGPWVQSLSAAARADPPMMLLAKIAFRAIGVAVCVGTAVVVRRSLRLGRGDRRGARRLATFAFSTVTVANLFRADHSWGAPGHPEFHLLIQIVSQGLYLATAVWLFYMALEPAVRRRWPDTLISWSRLLDGRFLDPLVGRDLLVGVLAALAVTLEFPLVRLIPAWFGQPPMSPVYFPTIAALSAPWHMAYAVFLSPVTALIHSLAALFFLYLLHALVKRAWVARLLLFVVWIPLAAAGVRQDFLVVFLAVGIFGAIWVALLVRFGQLASAAFLFTVYVLVRTPLTLDWSAWYAGRSFAVLGFFAALMIAAFYTSLGGKPLFGKALIED